MAYVYRHIRLDTNQPFYVGVGADCVGKHSRAYHTHNRTRFWHSIAKKQGYKVDVLVDNLTYSDALESEMYFIRLYGRININNGTLCNLTDGGTGATNRIVRLETKEKISKAHKGRKHTEQSRLNIRNAQISRVLTEEARLKIVLAHKGKKSSDATKKKMSEKGKGKKHTNETKLKISICNLGKKRTTEQKLKMSSVWKNRDEENKKQIGLRQSNNHQSSKIVLCKENGVFYLSITEASKIYGLSDVYLSMMLNGKYKNKTNLILA